ncbi:MAG: hypothetical protein AB7O62_17975 [Pirellulales bacterium]
MIAESGHKQHEQPLDLDRLAAVVGKWQIDESKAEFTAYDDRSFKIGIALSNVRATSGRFKATVQLSEVNEGAAHFVLGYDGQQQSGYTIGLGGFDCAYSVTQCFLPRGSRKLFGIGTKENIKAGRSYVLDVELQGQAVKLSVDDTLVLEYTLPQPLPGDQLGFKGYGDGRVTFSDAFVDRHAPRAFVIMQFSEPYDSLWEEVIRPVAKNAGFDPHRADDVFRPGVILQDIVRGIKGSDVVIAEVTPKNANVFYELGYAHALGKPTILLAEHPEATGERLPFDISGYRCIFYDDAIRGKRKVEEALRKHLDNIKNKNDEMFV